VRAPFTTDLSMTPGVASCDREVSKTVRREDSSRRRLTELNSISRFSSQFSSAAAELALSL